MGTSKNLINELTIEIMSVFALVAFFAVISGTKITMLKGFCLCSRYKISLKKLYNNLTNSLYYLNLTAFDNDGIEQYEDEFKNQLANGNISLSCFI